MICQAAYRAAPNRFVQHGVRPTHRASYSKGLRARPAYSTFDTMLLYRLPAGALAGARSYIEPFPTHWSLWRCAALVLKQVVGYVGQVTCLSSLMEALQYRADCLAGLFLPCAGRRAKCTLSTSYLPHSLDRYRETTRAPLCLFHP